MTTHGSPLRDALKSAASALLADGPRFALTGSYALWVHGGPEPTHDVDLVVAEADTEHAVTTSAARRTGRPRADRLATRRRRHRG